MKDTEVKKIKPVNMGLFPAVEQFMEHYALRTKPKFDCGGVLRDERVRGAVFSVEPIGNSVLKLSDIYPDGEVFGVGIVSSRMKAVNFTNQGTQVSSVCDQGRYYKFSHSGPDPRPLMEKAGSSDHMVIVAKDDNEGLVVKKYMWINVTYAFGMLPGMRIRNVFTYRFPQISNEPIKFEIPGAMQLELNAGSQYHF
ncbi:hypothetical protein FACS1894116_03710 [Betaproteobacteria bacterium]|nr:hypothetical protein FACS1894116_03710 [Betaproteobacteria bacterium]GHT99040.1 hypothetical protein FACS1894154_05390 [Betaproteobacteria bacterium]GHU24881.1 hypothetical protein FACS189488_10510 [Betaproteobacteria bacterium]